MGMAEQLLDELKQELLHHYEADHEDFNSSGRISGRTLSQAREVEKTWLHILDMLGLGNEARDMTFKVTPTPEREARINKIHRERYGRCWRDFGTTISEVSQGGQRIETFSKGIVLIRPDEAALEGLSLISKLTRALAEQEVASKSPTKS